MNYLFDKNWFIKHQRKLLWLLNTPIIRNWFRWVLRLKKYGWRGKGKITKITPNSVAWGDNLIWNTKEGRLEIERIEQFDVRNENSRRLYEAFKPLWYLFHAWDLGFANRFIPQLNLGFDTLTVYPDAGTSGPGGDWRASRQGVNEEFATIRAGAGNANDGGAAAEQDVPFLSCTTSTNSFGSNHRGIINIDTSSLTSSASISAATLSLYFTIKKNTITGMTSAEAGVAIVGNSSASDKTPDNASYNSMGSTRFATDIAYDSITTSAYNDYSFNASGIAGISKTGVSHFGIMLAVDLDNGSPGWSSGSETYYDFYFGDNTTNKPKLVITYTTSTAYTTTCSETLSISDTISKSTKFNKSITETLSMTEGISKSQGMSKSLTENISLSDVISSAIQRGLNLLETIHLTDTLQKTTRFAKTLTESISLTDTLASAKQFFVNLSETIGLTDAIERTTKFAKTISETLHLTDVIKVAGWWWAYLFKRTSSYDYKSKSTNTWTDKTKSKNTWTYKDK